MKGSELKAGAPFSGFFSVKYKKQLQPYKNKPGFFFNLGLSDSSAEFEATFWGGPKEETARSLHTSISEGDVVFVSGLGDEFNKKTKISINEEKGEMRLAREGEYDMADLVPVSNQDLEALFAHLLGLAKGFTNQELRALVLSFLEDEKFAAEFKKAPAAISHHHACVGGLLEHTWAVVRICEAVCGIHPSIDRDLALAGATLHDIGKTREFRATTNIKITEEGSLRTHISIGEEMVLEKGKSLSEPLKSKLLHIILTHHGKKENGAIKEPIFPEAKLVAMADDLDAQVTKIIRIKKDTVTEDFRTVFKGTEVFLR
jgi:3'-5' exoribonuclease